MKRLLSASALGIALSIVVAASIQAYDEPTSPCAAAKSGSCCKDAGECSVLKAAQTSDAGKKSLHKTPRAFAIQLDLDFDGTSESTKESQCNCCEGSGGAGCAEKECDASKCIGKSAKCCTDDADATGCCADKANPSSCVSDEKLACQRKVRDGEAAKVLIEVLDQIGPSVLEGTAFDCDSCPVGAGMEACTKPRSIRQQLVEYVHKLEAEDTCEGDVCHDACEFEAQVPISCGFAVEPPCPACPVVPYGMPVPGSVAMAPSYAPHPTPYYATPYVASAVAYPAAPEDAAIVVLRDAAETLERTAAQLERHNLYDSSDLTREMAGHLRLEGRRLQQKGSKPPESKSAVETTTHLEEAKHSPKSQEANQAWYFGGVRVSR